MPRFMVEIRHDPGRCLHTFDEMVDFDRRLLLLSSFGCTSGDHRGWAFVDRPTEREVEAMIPFPLRTRSTITQVIRLGPRLICSLQLGRISTSGTVPDRARSSGWPDDPEQCRTDAPGSTSFTTIRGPGRCTPDREQDRE